MRQLNPIGKSVSVSFRVRVVRACVRAKLCGRVVEVFFKAGVQNGNISSGPGLVLGIFVAIGMGFNHFWIICNHMHGLFDP